MTQPQQQNKNPMSRFQLVLASVVTVVWVASLIARVAIPNSGSQFGVLDTIALLVFGFIFGISAIRKSSNGNAAVSGSEVAK